LYTSKETYKRDLKETYKRDPYDGEHVWSATYVKGDLYTSKETCKRDLKETYKRDLQKRPTYIKRAMRQKRPGKETH